MVRKQPQKHWLWWINAINDVAYLAESTGKSQIIAALHVYICVYSHTIIITLVHRTIYIGTHIVQSDIYDFYLVLHVNKLWL